MARQIIKDDLHADLVAPAVGGTTIRAPAAAKASAARSTSATATFVVQYGRSVRSDGPRPATARPRSMQTR